MTVVARIAREFIVRLLAIVVAVAIIAGWAMYAHRVYNGCRVKGHAVFICLDGDSAGLIELFDIKND